mmetsp:Transcript_45843/g.73738  ORF Transcript_45843/g.73738 Transcript_45843/m.73738 type:complete len:95 (+) Transcript_45843:380-664(+)
MFICVLPISLSNSGGNVVMIYDLNNSYDIMQKGEPLEHPVLHMPASFIFMARRRLVSSMYRRFISSSSTAICSPPNFTYSFTKWGTCISSSSLK